MLCRMPTRTYQLRRDVQRCVVGNSDSTARTFSSHEEGSEVVRLKLSGSHPRIRLQVPTPYSPFFRFLADLDSCRICLPRLLGLKTFSML